MSNPTINFRLSTYQLARGLQIIRNLEPDYQLTSVSKIVKVLYFDYLAKMSINKKDSIPQHFVDEIESLIYQPKRVIKTLNQEIKINSTKEEKSIKSTVEDFSPPEDWDIFTEEK